MPLNDHEQRILDKIEKRLAEDDPSFVEQVGRTDLYTHLSRRIRISAFTFVVGLLLLLLFAVSAWFAVVGFGLMLVSAVVIYRSLGQLGRDQLRLMQDEGAMSVTGLIGRIAERFRRQ